MPWIVEYKWEEARGETLPDVLPSLFPPVSEEEYNGRFQKLHEKWAQPLYDNFMELGGFYYKVRQSVRVAYFGLAPFVRNDVISRCSPSSSSSSV